MVVIARASPWAAMAARGSQSLIEPHRIVRYPTPNNMSMDRQCHAWAMRYYGMSIKLACTPCLFFFYSLESS